MRLAIFADDSMLGRSALNSGHHRAVRYLAREAARIGLEPAGENGTYFQTFTIRARRLNSASRVIVADTILRPVSDFKVFPVGRGELRPIAGTEVIFGGIVGDSSTHITAQEAAGRLVLLGVPANMTAARVYANVIYGPESRFKDAVAVAIASLDYLPPPQRSITSTVGLADSNQALANSSPTSILVSRRAAQLLLGRDVETVSPGVLGRKLTGELQVDEVLHPTTNVVALFYGTDPVLRHEYVALGAHSDHLGIAPSPLEHDPDSIFNGADDNGSGSVALLEVAEQFAANVQPKRSVLFVWHAAEELGLLGSAWFTDHPTVPLESIVAHVNLDMVGRGGTTDVGDGGPEYLHVIGADRRSGALERAVDDVNTSLPHPFTLIKSDPHGSFCRSDHWSYARRGIPVAFFTTGRHADYHQVTDEIQYIDYTKLERVTRFISAIVLKLANSNERFEPIGVRPRLGSFCSG